MRFGISVIVGLATVWTAVAGAGKGPDTAALAAIEATRVRAVDDFRRGLEILEAGDDVVAGTVMASARIQLRQAGDMCALTAGCDLVVFVRTLDSLLEEYDAALVARLRAAEDNGGIDLEPLDADEGAAEFAEDGADTVEQAIPELGETARLLRGIDLAEVIRLNDEVQGALEDWLTWMRPNLMESYRNYAQLRERIVPVYAEAELPEALLFAMVASESGGKAHAVSRAGAAGILQFMRATGQLYGLGTEGGFDTRFDPLASTRANVRYLNDQFAALNNDLEKALAAYNGGENRMKSLERRYPGVPLWDPRIYHSLPRETREYVPRILAAAWLFLHPEDYDVRFPKVDPAVVTVDLARPASLFELAICLGQAGGQEDGWFRALRNLNPRYESETRLPQGTQLEVPRAAAAAYSAQCVEGPLVARAADVYAGARAQHVAADKAPAAASAASGDGQYRTYVVKRGDTLGRIASKYPCATSKQLARLNGIKAPKYVVRPGQKLRVPICN